MQIKVMTIGMIPEAVDYSKFPDLTPEKVAAGLTAMEAQLRDAGFAVRLCLVGDDDQAATTVARNLTDFAPQVVIVGAGLRNSPHLFNLFETVIDLIARVSAGASVGFNTRPDDTLEAVHRAMSRRP